MDYKEYETNPLSTASWRRKICSDSNDEALISFKKSKKSNVTTAILNKERIIQWLNLDHQT